MSSTDQAAAAGPAHRPRAVALVGPYGSGKSTLFEALLAAAGGPLRRAAERNTHAMGTETRLAHARFLGDSWSLLDCPGSVEFASETEAALGAVDLAVLVCDAAAGKALASAPFFRMIEDRGLPYLIFINRIDTLDGSVRDTLAALQAQAGRKLILRQVPIREGERITGYVDVVSERAYRYRPGAPSELIPLPPAVAPREREAHEALIEVLADHDDALLESVLADVVPAPAELYQHLRKDLGEATISGALLGAAERGHGVQRLWKALRHDTPDPLQTAAHRGIGAAGGPLAQVFKTVYAGHAGKLSYARIWRGTLRDGGSVNGGRIGGIQRFPGGEPAKAAEAEAGEIVALGRLEGVPSGTTLGGGETLGFPAPPAPVHAFAISTAERKDDVRLSAALQKLIEEDPSLVLHHDGETGETILAGQGEIHLNAALEKLARAYGLKVATAHPRPHFKETIRRAVHQHGRLKRQTGGHGQFADVKIDIAPRESGAGFAFIDRIVGGAVPRQYIPAVGEAAEEATRKGPFGYPVVDISVTLVDGGFHSVDSSDMAFKTATRIAMTEGLAAADPVLLEPIDHVTVSAPNEFTASVQRVLSGRRGQILGYGERPDWPGWDDVEALVPEAELHGLIIELRSQTMGMATYRRRFDHLAEAHGRLAEKMAREAVAR